MKFRSALVCLTVLHIAAAFGLSSNDGLLHEPYAAGKLKALLSEANLAGQCYALLGLYILHDAAYQENFARYKSSDARVKTVGGCMITEQSVSSVVSNIAAGRYDWILNAPIH